MQVVGGVRQSTRENVLILLQERIYLNQFFNGLSPFIGSGGGPLLGPVLEEPDDGKNALVKISKSLGQIQQYVMSDCTLVLTGNTAGR